MLTLRERACPHSLIQNSRETVGYVALFANHSATEQLSSLGEVSGHSHNEHPHITDT